MHRRLTFDANPKELASRDSGTTHISLLWSRRFHRAAVIVEDDDTGEIAELEVEQKRRPLDLYEHALAYGFAPRPPGRHAGPPDRSRSDDEFSLDPVAVVVFGRCCRRCRGTNRYHVDSVRNSAECSRTLRKREVVEAR